MRAQIPVLSGAELRIPEPFGRLYDLAYNLWWSWDPVGYGLWQQISPRLWERYRNPIELLEAVDPATWEALESSESFLDLYRRVLGRFDGYLENGDTWFDRNAGTSPPGPIAYLCVEYGVYPTLPFYSGGLGVLAGDHLKSASDLGIPLLAVGMLYRRGYFHQEVDAEGLQQHIYPLLDVHRLPVRGVAGPTGGQLKVQLDFPGRSVWAAVWCLQLGRVPLLLLDTSVSENEPADRPISHTLYVRGREMRLCQELVLGVGGVRALQALDVRPAAWHVNEGHASFSLLERLSRKAGNGASLEEARTEVRSTTLFTLHTPVPAGNEVFDRRLVEKYLGSWGGLAGTDLSRVTALGARRDEEEDEGFDLSALAIRLSGVVNGVSRRHASVVSRDWGHLLTRPARAITNGIHPATWAGRGTQRLLTELIGPDWAERIDDAGAWDAVRTAPDETVWQTHLDQKRMLARFARGRILRQLARQGASPDELRSVDRLLPPERLTIGFARRFTAYKRATLLFHDPAWLRSILTDSERPVQVIFAGKAHPADREGQELIRQIVEAGGGPELGGHVYFLEDYDMRMARFLTQGVDVWLNNPRPPQEASGTSGMKAALNGAVNLSILDGWWAEGYNGRNGWAFGQEWEHQDPLGRDDEDAASLYRVLQDEVVPLYYRRGADGVPRGWVEMMKESISGVAPYFNTHRMLAEYTTHAYLPLTRGELA